MHLHTDPRQAAAQLDQVDPDLVLVDLHMPHLDGYAVLDRLRVHAAGAYLPALVLTADTGPQAIQRALSSGARDFLTEPFDATEVVLRVRNRRGISPRGAPLAASVPLANGNHSH